jgi:hypothetical protein
MPPSRIAPDVAEARAAWRERQSELNPARLVFIDETWATTSMARRYGRTRRGQRLVASVPHGQWETSTFLAALRQDKVTAPCVLDGAINGELFLALCRTVPRPQPGSGRHRHHREPELAQGRRPASGNRSRRRYAALPAPLQPGSQPDRAVLLKAQGVAAKGRRSDPRCPACRHCCSHRCLSGRRVRKLPCKRRLPST